MSKSKAPIWRRKSTWLTLLALLTLGLGYAVTTPASGATPQTVSSVSAKPKPAPVRTVKTITPSLGKLFNMNGKVVITTKAAAFAHAAASGISITQGPGVMIDGHFFGAYVETYGGTPHLLYCVTPLKGLHSGQPLSVESVLAAIGPARSQELEYILYWHGNTVGHPRYAAAVSVALNKIIGNAAPNVNAWLQAGEPGDKDIIGLANSHIYYASLRHGPYHLALTTARQVIIGQPTTAVVHLTSVTGHALPGNTVHFSYLNGAGAAQAVTGPYGYALATYWPTTALLAVKITATVNGLAPTAMLVSQPASAYEQTLLGRLPGISQLTTLSYRKVTAAPTWSYGCSTRCNGSPPLTVKFCNPAGADSAYLHIVDNGKTILTMVLPKNTRAVVCKAATVTVHDQQRVTFNVQYRRGDGTYTAPEQLGGFVVDCPPAPVVSMTASCSCVNANLVFALPVNHSSHTEAIIVSGKFVAFAAPSHAASYTLRPSLGHAATYTFQGAVRRNNGQWNVGPKLLTGVA